MADRPRGRLLVFIDANVLIRGLTLPRFPYEILRAGALSRVRLVTSRTTLAKARYYIEMRFPSHLERFDRFLDTSVIAVVEDPSQETVCMHPDLVRDEDDVPVALAAIQAGAQYLVSTDPDLTVVDKSTVELRRRITPIRPGDFLKEVLGWTSTELSRIERRTWEALEAEEGE